MIKTLRHRGYLDRFLLQLPNQSSYTSHFHTYALAQIIIACKESELILLAKTAASCGFRLHVDTTSLTSMDSQISTRYCHPNWFVPVVPKTKWKWPDMA